MTAALTVVWAENGSMFIVVKGAGTCRGRRNFIPTLTLSQRPKTEVSELKASECPGMHQEVIALRIRPPQALILFEVHRVPAMLELSRGWLSERLMGKG